MLKQILAKLPKKLSKSDTLDPLGSDSYNGTSNIDNKGQGFNTCNVLSGRLNVVKKKSWAIFPTSISSGGSDLVEPQMPFKDVPNSDKQSLLVSKLNLCCIVYDFNDTSKDSKEKDLKQQILLELGDYIASGSAKFTEPVIAAVSKMCSVNLFRDFPPKCNSNTPRGECEDDEPLFDPAWSHLQLVYDLFLRFLNQGSLDAKLSKKYIDHSFIIKILDLFESEDPRERDCLKSILHRLYGKFMMHRPFIRKAVSNIFYRFVYETERHNGIAELLEVFGSVISGFAVPLKEEHKVFLLNALIPLHKPKSLGIYHQQLAYCIVQFVEKDPKLASIVIKGLLKFWPVTNSQKQLMFLSEFEELLEMINVSEFEKIMVPLFRRIGYCLCSYQFQVAERAHFLWNNDHILNLFMQHKQVIMPMIISVLEKNSQCHWNRAVLNLTQNVKKMLFEMDEDLAISCQTKTEEERLKLNNASETRKLTWERLENAASCQSSTPIKTMQVL